MTEPSSPPSYSEPARDLAEEREPQGLATRRIALLGAGTGAALLLSLGGLLLFFHVMAGDPRQGFRPEQQFPPPRLESDPAGDLRAFQAKQQAELQGYAWVDQQRGLVRVPIERAMQLIAGRGDAAYGPLEPAP